MDRGCRGRSSVPALTGKPGGVGVVKVGHEHGGQVTPPSLGLLCSQLGQIEKHLCRSTMLLEFGLVRDVRVEVCLLKGGALKS